MKIQIKYVKDAGDLDNERLILEALDDEEIGSYIVADTTYEGNETISNKLRNVFWIPDKEVSKGDLIVIYTKSGNDKSKKNKSGTYTHFFYWGLDRTIWNVGNDAATIFKIRDWVMKAVQET